LWGDDVDPAEIASFPNARAHRASPLGMIFRNMQTGRLVGDQAPV
jgi:hypothetical protein